MSSHHIVREAQEPAVFILEPNACPYHLIQEMLEWSPLILVGEGALEEVLTWGIKIDVFLYQKTDPSDLEKKLQDQLPVTMIFALENILKAGLEYLISRQHKSVYLIQSSTSDTLIDQFTNTLEIVMYQGHFKIIKVERGFWKKWLVGDTQLKIVGDDLRVVNLSHSLEGDWYRVVKDGFVIIDQASKPFWLWEEIIQ